MNPATINSPATNFTLTDSSGIPVPGTVTYVAATYIATFTPTNSLTASATYTATITTGVADTSGNTLAADYPWTVTTLTSAACTPPLLQANPLGAACSFGALAYTTVTNTGNTNIIGTGTSFGDIGVSPTPGNKITGFPPAGPGTLTGTENVANAYAAAGEAAAHTAYTNFAAEATQYSLPADIGGLTYGPGVYTTAGSLGITGNLTLTGSATDVWVFQIGFALNTATGALGLPASEVLLTGGALPQNVYWVVGSSATLNDYSIFRGNILAYTSISLKTGVTLDGTALALGGAVTFIDDQVTLPPSCP
jgi:hypothetical protein